MDPESWVEMRRPAFMEDGKILAIERLKEK